jgi:hypothetical protein
LRYPTSSHHACPIELSFWSRIDQKEQRILGFRKFFIEGKPIKLRLDGTILRLDNDVKYLGHVREGDGEDFDVGTEFRDERVSR